jgi:hypothetical protein
MKKIVRTLAVVLVLGITLVGCSKDDDNEGSGPIIVEKNNLIGKYKITEAVVASAIDSNGDGVKSNDLLKEGYNACTYDNLTEITETNFNYILQGKACDASETNQTNTYVISEDKKTITVSKDGKVIETLKNVELDKNSAGKSELYFNKFDDTLKQDVFFTLQKI